MTIADEELRHDLEQLFDGGYRVMSSRGETIVRGRLHRRSTDPDRLTERVARRLDAVHYSEVIAGRRYLTFTMSPRSRRVSKWKANLLLFLLTVLSTLAAGSFLSGENPLSDPASLWIGVPFSATIMAVLGLHELGHYLAARRYRLNVTLPYFIPFPTIIGTLGAVIRMKSPIHHRRMLMDIGVAGPIMSFLVSIPVTYFGLLNSHFEAVDAAAGAGSIHLGSSLVFHFLSVLALGTPPEGYDVVLHPVAFAGWVGFFVTALNLIPIGQLDGGHIIYSLIGPLQKKVSTVIFILLLALGGLSLLGTGWPGWFLWAVLIFFLARIPHPPVIDEEVPLGRGRRVVGIIALVIFLLTFIPNPIQP
jgi:membrane-associated protease RseP (regulator of RpoE activity)